MAKSPLSGDTSLAIIEAIPQGVIITATATRTFVYANAAACSMFGYSKSDLEGRTLADIYPPDAVSAIAAVFDDQSTGAFPAGLRLPCLRKDGTLFYADTTGVRIVIDGTPCTVGFFIDVTEQLQAEQALQKTREIASKVFSTSPSAIAIAIARLSDGVFLDINPGFTELTGYTRDDMMGRTALPGDLGIWTSLEDRQRLVLALQANQGTARIDARFRRKDGYVIHGVMHARVMSLDDEPYLLTITNDISDIKLAEMALFAEKERLAVTLQSIGDAVITTDTDGHVRLMNRVAEELTGWRQDESLGQPLARVFDTVHETTGRPCENPAAKVLASGAVVEFGNQTVLIARDGTRRLIADSGAPIRDATGTILGVVLVFRDTTESTRAETLLRQSEEKFRTIIEQNADGIALLDEFGTVIEWNPALEHISGVTRNQAIGKPVWETQLLLQPATAESAQGADTIRALFAGGLSRSDSPLFLRNKEVSASRQEEELTLHQTVFPIKTERGFRVGCIVRDITQQKKLSAALQKADKLESLGVLAGGIAHDFNNLLGGIFGNVELACAVGKDPEVMQYLQASMGTMGRVRALTQQLLTFAKGGAPVKRVEPLFPFVRTAVEFALSGANVACRFDVAPGLWNCSYDKHQMGQVVDNIVINAVQAMPLGGSLEVSALNLVVGENEYPSLAPGRYVRASFADQGPGIPSAIMTHIFDPFFTTRPAGSGLGLATCYSILRQHSGCITVESEPGRGSVFHALLPASEAAVYPNTRSSDDTHRGSGTILVMDDDEGVRTITRKFLEHMGYSCRTARDGHEALREYRCFQEEGGRWRAIICDLTVRGSMSGKACASEIRQVDQETQIIVASGYADDPILADPKQYGFDDSLPKPYTASELGQVLGWNQGSVPES
jgi:PAS domain S-box-containing protein